jgi:hypothetical protein
MRDGLVGQVVEASQHLIGVDFDEERSELFLLDDLVEIVTVVVHDHIKVLFGAFGGEEVVLHF